MRIGIFTDTYPPFINGVSTSISMLEKGLIEQGHEVYIVTVNPDDLGYKYENDDRILRIPGIPIGIYDYRLTGIYPLKALNKIKSWNLDIIHSHTEFGVGTFARIIAKQYNIPLVHTYHTMYEDYVHYITHGYFDKSSRKLVEYFTKFYCDKTATELIVPSKKTYDLFKEKYKVDKGIHIIPTGIDTERFHRDKLNSKELDSLKKELKIAKDNFVLLYVGRLAEEKNVEFLLESHAEIIKKYPKIKLMIVGSGPDYEKFISYAEELKIIKNVIFTSAIPYDEIPKYYAISNAFVTASTTETQGLTVIEATAASLPVLCIDDESFNTYIVNDLNGYLFHNKQEYIKWVYTLYNDKKKVAILSKQAHVSSEKYSLKYYAEQVLAVYKVALADVDSNKTFFGRIKNVVKGGFHGK